MSEKVMSGLAQTSQSQTELRPPQADQARLPRLLAVSVTQRQQLPCLFQQLLLRVAARLAAAVQGLRVAPDEHA